MRPPSRVDCQWLISLGPPTQSRPGHRCNMLRRKRPSGHTGLRILCARSQHKQHSKMAGWLRGVVKEVPSGDQVVIVGAVKSGPPPEKRLTLSSIIAPKLGKRDGSSRDEPFAWESREFLRKLVAGQQVVFKVDYTVEAIGNREFGSVFLGQENVAVSVVSAGMGKVRASGTQQSPYIENLKKAEESAQLAGKGLWTKDPGATNAAVRTVPSTEAGFSASAYLAAAGGKGAVVTGIVEQVTNGGMLRVTMLPDFQAATVVVCGVQAPSMGRKPTAASDTTDTSADSTAPGVVAPSAASIAAASASEPFAWEAKYSTEMRALSREVRFVLEGVDKYDNLFASVYVPPAAGGPADAKEDSLAELLIRTGYAKCVEWSLALMSTGAQKLRELERQAKLERKGMWTNYVPAPSNQSKLSDSYTGKVVEVVSGDCLVIKDSASGLERRVQLSSLRAPRMGARDRAPDAWAVDAREFLRKKLIGREVEVKMEYTRKVPAAGDVGSGDERVLAFGNVELVPNKGEEKQNVSEMAVARGFATVIKHRTDEERSCVYEKLVECEDMAKAAKRGVHSAKEPAANRINDVSAPGSAAKAKQYLPFFQRAGKMTGVVDFVLSGHRLKVTIPKEGAMIVFAPSGIKTPSRAQAAGHGKPAVQGEPFADEAVSFTREHALQRDCEITVETMDKGGTFLGTITILPAAPGGKPLDLPLALMKAGLAKLQATVDPSRITNGNQLLAAQQEAKQARLKIWQNWTPDMDKTAEDEEEEEAAPTNGAPRQREVMEVTVTEVVDANEFYVQKTKEPRVQWIAEQLRLAGEADGPAIPPELKPGQLCIAQYSADKQWYRAYVEKAMALAGQYDVFFIDFGNREKVSDKCVRVIDAALAAVPPQAHMCSLAFVKVPFGNQEYAAEARGLLFQLLGGGLPLTATIIAKERPGAKDNAKHPKWTNGHLRINLTDPSTQADLAVELLCAGLARLPKLKRVRDQSTQEAITALSPYEEEAKEAHRGIFVYGDPGDSEDEDAAPAPRPAWGKK